MVLISVHPSIFDPVGRRLFPARRDVTTCNCCYTCWKCSRATFWLGIAQELIFSSGESCSETLEEQAIKHSSRFQIQGTLVSSVRDQGAHHLRGNVKIKLS